MKKILIIRSIFCPNDTYLNITINAIDNLYKFLDLVNKEDLTFSILFIGWIKRKEYEIIIKNKTTLFHNTYDLWLVNYGKYYIFNKMKDYIKDNDFLFYSDHDIIIPLTNTIYKNIFHTINNLMQTHIQNKMIGLIAPLQLEDNRHKSTAFENSIMINNMKLYYTNDSNAIACGCFFIKCEYVKRIDNFNLQCVYGLDDKCLIEKIDQLGYISVVSHDIKIIHPFDNNENYKKWKIEIVKRLIENKNNYYQSLESAINFWSGL